MSELVTKDNIKQFQQAFALTEGHTMDCVDETVEQMANLLKTTCMIQQVPVEAIVESMDVEDFDVKLRKILQSKDCNCNKEPS